MAWVKTKVTKCKVKLLSSDQSGHYIRNAMNCVNFEGFLLKSVYGTYCLTANPVMATPSKLWTWIEFYSLRNKGSQLLIAISNLSEFKMVGNHWRKPIKIAQFTRNVWIEPEPYEKDGVCTCVENTTLSCFERIPITWLLILIFFAFSYAYKNFASITKILPSFYENRSIDESSQYFHEKFSRQTCMISKNRPVIMMIYLHDNSQNKLKSE